MDYDKIIRDFIIGNWGTKKGEEIYIKRRMVLNTDSKEVKKIYDYMVENEYLRTSNNNLKTSSII